MSMTLSLTGNMHVEPVIKQPLLKKHKTIFYKYFKANTRAFLLRQ